MSLDGPASFSPCRQYRYALFRCWNGGQGTVNFIGLNPSTADETLDDPTIRRCIGYARAWGYSSLRMLNLFAYRATDPKRMMAVHDPVGDENDDYIKAAIGVTACSVAAWGNGGWYRGRGPFIADIYRGRLKMLRLTKQDHPAHPLYLPKHLTPQDWR